MASDQVARVKKLVITFELEDGRTEDVPVVGPSAELFGGIILQLSDYIMGTVARLTGKVNTNAHSKVTLLH